LRHVCAFWAIFFTNSSGHPDDNPIVSSVPSNGKNIGSDLENRLDGDFGNVDEEDAVVGVGGDADELVRVVVQGLRKNGGQFINGVFAQSDSY
jgi:hypothetical protein